MFRVDANVHIGWGHFYRSFALAQMLMEEFYISFAMIEPDVPVGKLLESKGFDLISLAIQEYVRPEDHRGEELQFDLGNHLLDVDCVVLDGYWFGTAYQSKLRVHEVKVAVIEDNGRGHYLADLIINHAPGLNSEAYSSDNPSTQYALGPKYAMLRQSFLVNAAENKNRSQEIRSDHQIFICFGGSDHHDFTGRFTREILSTTELAVVAVLGGGYAYRKGMEELKSAFPKRLSIRSNLDADEMIEVMTACSLGIVPSSGILFECLACRLPVLTGFYTQNQLAIYNGWRETGAVEPLDDIREIEGKELVMKINQLDRKNIIKRQVELVDGTSGTRFCNLFTSLVA